MKEYTEKQASGFLLVGLVLGIFSMAYLIWFNDDTIYIKGVNKLEPPERVYEVTVDDILFTCKKKPRIRNTRIKLRDCAESFGSRVVIKGFNSYSIEIVE